MSLHVKDKSISRTKQVKNWAWEFYAHADELRKMWRDKRKNSKRITLRTHRTGI